MVGVATGLAVCPRLLPAELGPIRLIGLAGVAPGARRLLLVVVEHLLLLLLRQAIRDEVVRRRRGGRLRHLFHGARRDRRRLMVLVHINLSVLAATV